MKGENPDESVSVKKKNKCRCCLKPFTDDNEANELTVKIVKQFLKLTNVQVN